MVWKDLAGSFLDAKEKFVANQGGISEKAYFRIESIILGRDLLIRAINLVG